MRTLRIAFIWSVVVILLCACNKSDDGKDTVNEGTTATVTQETQQKNSDAKLEIEQGELADISFYIHEDKVVRVLIPLLMNRSDAEVRVATEQWAFGDSKLSNSSCEYQEEYKGCFMYWISLEFECPSEPVEMSEIALIVNNELVQYTFGAMYAVEPAENLIIYADEAAISFEGVGFEVPGYAMNCDLRASQDTTLTGLKTSSKEISFSEEDENKYTGLLFEGNGVEVLIDFKEPNIKYYSYEILIQFEDENGAAYSLEGMCPARVMPIVFVQTYVDSKAGGTN